MGGKTAWLLCFASVAIAACASGEPESAPPPALNYAHGDQAVYALLVKDGDGQFTFREVSDQHYEPDKGYLVRLNDLSPAFDSRAVECRGEPTAENDKCNDKGDFRSKRHGVVSALITGSKAVSSAGASLAESNAPYVTEFDAAEFNRAVDDALRATGLDVARTSLLEDLDRLRVHRDAFAGEAAALHQRYVDDYRRDLSRAMNLVPTIDGATEYYDPDTRFDSLFELEPNRIAGPAEAAADTEVLPCEASRCAAEAAAALGSLQREQAAALRRLETTLKEQTSVYRMRCDASRHAGYNLDLDCPRSVPRSTSPPVDVPVRVTVLSRDFEHLYPDFEHADDNLRIDFDGRELTLSNLAESYLEVKSVSVYYNSKINTVSPLEPSLELAPGAHARVSIDRFVSRPIRIEARYSGITADKARRASLQFGFAVKYSLTQRDVEQTLYRAATYGLDCAIRNRLTPGSCKRPEAEGEEIRPVHLTI